MPSTATTRPADRKAQIAAAAAALFKERGYHAISMADLAAAVGITSRAIYSHFDGKQDLLRQLVLDGVDRLEHAEGTAALVSVSLDDRTLGVLLTREARHLDAADRRALHPRLARLPGLPVILSPSHHSVELARPRADELLADAAARVAAIDLGTRAPRLAPAPRASRREAVLAGAVELFAARGYGAVRMEDVGAAAGIAGPSIYEHFESKADLLMAVLTRGAEWLQLGLTEALAAPGDRLEAVLRSYVEFSLQHADLMSVLLDETINLPDHSRHALRRVQRAYVAEWVDLLTAARPDLENAEAWFLVHAVLNLVNARDGSVDGLITAGKAVLA